VAVDARTVSEPDGNVVTLIRFRKSGTRFGLHVGSTDPPAPFGSIPPGTGSAVSTTERPLLLAAFNGGFKSTAGAGGFEVAGAVLVPFIPGYASLVIAADGSASVGAWGAGVPARGERVVSVRQNLPPLVVSGRPSAQIADVYAWGATLGGVAAVARSALGEDMAGNLIYAGSTAALPYDMAAALISGGSVSGMELDINPEWVQADVAPVAGGPLAAQVAHQTRPAGQYLTGWTRDFVTVLART
jgi:hypothetical protein